MSAQTWQDIGITVGMFFLRIGLPLLIVIGVGYLIRRWLEPAAVQEQFEGMVRSAQEGSGGVRSSPKACWEINNCPPEKRAQCAAAKQPDIPCWLARQIAGQPLPEGCMNCKVRALALDALERKV